MKLSIIIHLTTPHILHWRHLLASLTTDGPSEVLLYHDPGLELPDFPEHWCVRPFEEDNVFSSWTRGLEESTGDCVAFFNHVVSVHPEHFNLCIDAMAVGNMDAVFTRAEFVDTSFFPVEQYLPTLSVEDMPGFLLQSRLQWPVETFVFRKSALPVLPFGLNDVELPELFHLLPWLGEHQVEAIPAPTIEAAFSDFWKIQPEARLRKLLADYDTAQLLPAYARGNKLTPASVEAQSQRFICQGLLNQRCTNLFEELRPRFALPAPTAIFSSRKTESTVYWQLFHQTHTVRFIVEDHASPIEEPLCIYTQQKGVPQVRIYGFNQASRYGFDYENESLKNILIEGVSSYRAERIHALDIKPFGARALMELASANIPVYLSVIGDAFTQVRQTLKFPDSHSSAQHATHSALFRAQNLDLERLVEHHLAALICHQPEVHQRLIEQGYSRPQLIQNVYGLKQLYQAPVQISLRKKKVLPHYPHLLQDTGLIEKQNRVLCVGPAAAEMVEALQEEDIWCQGVMFDQTTVKQLQGEGLPIHQGKYHALSTSVRYFDTLYVAYVLETVTPESLRTLLNGMVLALKKGGRLILRGMLPGSSLATPVTHRRIYTAALVKNLLEYVGFDIEEEQLFEAEGSYRLKARLKVESIPQNALPVASPRLETYFQNHLPQLQTEEHERVLLVGTHITKSWLIYRVQCAYLLGITLNFAEMGKRSNKPEKYHFRHTRNALKTLKSLKTRFHKIALQNVLENETVDGALSLLKACYEVMEPEGQLVLYVLKKTYLWDGLYSQSVMSHRLEELAAEAGFSSASSQENEHHVEWVFQREDVLKAEKLPLTVSAKATAFEKRMRTQYGGQHFRFFFEEQAPGEVESQVQRLIKTLKRDDFLMITGSTAREVEMLPGPLMSSVTDPEGIKRLLQQHGMRQLQLKIFEDVWIWCGFKSIRHYQHQPTGFRLHWHGDVLNSHTQARTSQALLKAWQPNTEVPVKLSISNDSDPEIVPATDTILYPLYQHMQKPFLASAHVSICHQMPQERLEVPEDTSHWVMMQPWDFGALPKNWIRTMNQAVDKVWVPSTFVKNCYLDSGLSEDRISVLPYGVDMNIYHPQTSPIILETQKKFKFLYVGTAERHKGLDLLLESYCQTFTQNDDVCLVVHLSKTKGYGEFLNLEEHLEALKQKYGELPEMLFMDTLTVDQMPALYVACEALVYPYRGESFALPVLEAMACETPVIVTEFGAALDFCTPENAFLISAEKSSFDTAQVGTMATVKTPFLAEPDSDVLQALMRNVYENPENIRGIAQEARRTVQDSFTWHHAVLAFEKELQTLQDNPVFRLHRDEYLEKAVSQGLAAVEAESYRKALEHFDFALKLSPEEPGILYNAGIAHLMLQEYQACVDALSLSIQAGAISGDICYAMGTALRHLGDQKGSQQFFAKAQELDPELFSMVEA